MQVLGATLIAASLVAIGWATHYLVSPQVATTSGKSQTALLCGSEAEPGSGADKEANCLVEQTQDPLPPASTVADATQAPLPAGLHQRIAALEEELDVMRQHLDQQTARFDRLQSTVRRQDDPHVEVEREMRQQEQAEIKAQQRIALLEDSVYAESVDPDWSPRAQDGIEQVLSEEALLDTIIFDVDCRATLCRVEVGHDDPTALARFQERFLSQVSDFLPEVLIEPADPGGDGTATLVVYLSRAGYGLPALESGQAYQ